MLRWAVADDAVEHSGQSDELEHETPRTRRCLPRDDRRRIGITEHDLVPELVRRTFAWIRRCGRAEGPRRVEAIAAVVRDHDATDTAASERDHDAQADAAGTDDDRHLRRLDPTRVHVVVADREWIRERSVVDRHVGGTRRTVLHEQQLAEAAGRFRTAADDAEGAVAVEHR